MTLRCADMYLDSLALYKALLNQLLLQTPVNIVPDISLHSWPIWSSHILQARRLAAVDR